MNTPRRSRRRFARKGESARIPGHDGRPEHSVSSIAGILRQAAPYLSAAWVMTAGLFAGLLLGRWLDRRLDSAPLFLLLGLGLGVTVGLWEVARVALRTGRGRDGSQGGDRG